MAWIETPTIISSHLSVSLQCNVFLKLENLQIGQSFKYRGIFLFAQSVKDTYGQSATLLIASGGNAGIAAASASRNLGLRCTVYIPDGISDAMMQRLKQEEAEVVVGGENYDSALQKAKEAVRENPTAVLVPAYDDPLLWEGHSSLIEEISRQIAPAKPDVICCSVGGGGLLGGVMTGCRKVGWDDVPLVTMETHGSACFYHSMAMNKKNDWKYKAPQTVVEEHDDVYGVAVARLERIESQATSLGASRPAAGIVEMALRRVGPIACLTVPDVLSMEATCAFAEDHKLLVELACATTLTAAYNPALFTHMWRNLGNRDLVGPKNVVFIVCGGVKISLDEIAQYKNIVQSEKEMAGEWSVCCNGETLKIPVQTSF